MARPIRNTVDYFPHIIGDGKKIYYIENKYGNDGYATWFKILEKLATTNNHFLNLNDEQDFLFLSAYCKVDESKLINIINDLSKIGAINKICWDKKIIWSDFFIESIQDAYSRRNNKCITYEGLCIHLLSLGIHLLDYCSENDDSNTQSKVKYSKVKKNKENIVSIIPSFDEFLNYAIEKKPKVSQTDLKLKYESWVANDWKNGNDKKIVNWKSALLNTLPYIKEGLNNDISLIDREEFMRNAGKM